MEREHRDESWQRVEARLVDALEGTTNIAGVEVRAAAAHAQRLESELQHHRERSATLLRIGRALHAARDFHSLLQLVADLAVDASGAERGLVVVPNALTKGEEATAASKFDASLVAAPEFAFSRSIIERVCRSGAAVISLEDDVPAEEFVASVTPLYPLAVICLPIRLRDSPIGAIYLDAHRATGADFHHDHDLLTTIADQAAIAIDNARRHEDLVRSYGELSTTKSQADQIVEAMSSGVLVVNRDGVVTQCSRAAEATLGVQAASLLGHNVRIVNTWLPGLTNLLERHIANHHELIHAELSVNHFVRGSFALRVMLVGIRDLRYRDAGTAIVMYDVTEGRTQRTDRLLQIEKHERMARSLERYLAPHVVRELLEDPDAAALGGVRQTATTLFADINNFTEIAEHMDPVEVVSLLNRYLAPLVDVVFNHGGLLDKFYGDGIMAVFGAPRPADDDAARAVAAAREMLEKVRMLNVGAQATRPLTVSIGLATGDVVAGHIGSSRRLEYTVIGDAVNLASRLESLAEPDQILADERTYERVQHLVTATPRPAFIKGKSGPETVYVLHA